MALKKPTPAFETEKEGGVATAAAPATAAKALATPTVNEAAVNIVMGDVPARSVSPVDAVSDDSSCPRDGFAIPPASRT